MGNERVTQAYRQGNFTVAYNALTSSPATGDLEAVLTAELLNYLGRSDEAQRAVTRLMRSGKLPKPLQCRCTSVLADEQWYSGKAESAVSLYYRAFKLAEEVGDADLLCRTGAQLLERTCDSSGFDISLPLATTLRRWTIRASDIHLHAHTHLTFGRLEAKVGHFSTAQRHFQLARKLLTDEPNQYLSASIDVDESVVLWLIGDIGGATELAQRGATAATEIGWSRGSVAARANLACLYVSSGRLSDAHEQVRRAKQERFSSVSTALALADTTARALMADERFDEAHRLITSVLEDPALVLGTG